jgi:hypothetical protein
LFLPFVATAWLRPKRRVRELALAGALIAGATFAVWAPWFDRQEPLAVITNAASAGDRYVNALWDLPTSWITRTFVDRRGVDLDHTQELVRSWPRTILRLLFAAYIAFELRRFWSMWQDSDAMRRMLEAVTRILLVGLLVVFNQVLAWYFTWPLATAATLGWQSRVTRLTVGYSVLYLPLFYAIHYGLIVETAPWLVGYALAPLVWVKLSAR